MTNDEILKFYLDNGLIETCLSFQFNKMKEPWKKQYSGDMLSDLCLVIANYDNEKLNNVHRNNHMNAWLTRVLQNQLYSNSSSFYRNYVKFNQQTEDLSGMEGMEDEE